MLDALKRLLMRTGWAGARQPVTWVEELTQASPDAAALFFKAFAQPIPDFPRHFVLVHAPEPERKLTLGYVHMTPFQAAYLAGGLAVDAWAFRRLPQQTQDEIRRHGGMAEWIMTEACKQVEPCDAVFAYIGDRKSQTVNERVGFRLTSYPYRYRLLNAGSPGESELAALTDAVVAQGPF